MSSDVLGRTVPVGFWREATTKLTIAKYDIQIYRRAKVLARVKLMGQTKQPTLFLLEEIIGPVHP